MSNAPKDGYLLLEVSIVLSLLVIMSLCVIPQLNWFCSLAVQAELKQLANQLRYYQYIARMSHASQKIICDSTGKYHTPHGMHQLCQGVKFCCLPNVYGPPSDPHHLVTKPITFAHNTIAIGSDGSMSAGTLYLTDASEHCLYALTVPIAHAIYFRLYQYIKGQWVRLS